MTKKIFCAALAAISFVCFAYGITADKSYVDKLHREQAQAATNLVVSATNTVYVLATNAANERLVFVLSGYMSSNQVIQAIFKTKDYIWDADLEVCYERVMNNGYLEYIAVTNVDLRNPANW